jgi:O-antigen biosynthesis protein WbqV
MALPSKPGPRSSGAVAGRPPGRPAWRIGLNIVIDGALAAAAVGVARWVAAPQGDPWHPLHQYVVGAACLLLAGLPFGLSRQYWRFAGLSDLLAVANASVLGAVFFIIVARLAGPTVPSPGFPVIHALVLLVLLGAPRVIYRRLRTRPAGRAADDAPEAVVIGAAEDADLFLRAIAQDRRQPMRIAGLLSANPRQAGRRIQGLPILGTVDDTPALLDRMAAERRLPSLLVIASPLDPARLSMLIEAAERHGIALRRAARPTALSPAMRGGGADLQPVAIEDLLNRRQVTLDREGMARLIQGRRVIVTGAGGTIGSELARQVAACAPDLLVLLDNGEYALWQIDLELAETHPRVARHAVIADIRDEARIRSLFDALRPALVFHAAALKHVPIVEANPLEGLLTNAVGTRIVADAARASGASAMVLISTDKAVNPTSVMGASKRLAEMYCQGLDIAAREAHAPSASNMRGITVRFGNVLGSTGSVVPLFQRQLARGGPLTVTHPDMQRYFMTVREAVGLVLQASVVGAAELGSARADASTPAQQGGIFVLDMGAPVKIVDLARQMIRLAGLRPDTDVEIRFTGLRPGEKLFEELFHGHEPPAPTGYPGLLMASPRTADPAFIGRALDEMSALCRAGQTHAALALLARLIPEFEPAAGRAHG